MTFKSENIKYMRTLDAMCHAHLRCHVQFLRSLTSVSMPTRPRVDVLVQHPTNNTPQHSKSTPAKAAVPHTNKAALNHAQTSPKHFSTAPVPAHTFLIVIAILDRFQTLLGNLQNLRNRPNKHSKASAPTQTIDTVRTSKITISNRCHPHRYAFLEINLFFY